VKEKLIQAFQDMIDLVVTAAPRVVMGIALLIVALVVAKIVEKLLTMILRRIRFDKLLGRVGIDKTLQRIGIRQPLNRFLPRLVYFLLLFLFAKTASDALELYAISEAIGSFFGYLPNIVAALLLVVLGSTAGQFVGQMVTQAAEESGIEFAGSLGRIVSGLILFFVGLMAVGQLRIDTEIIRIVTGILLAGVSVAFGLSFGLGTRDLTRNLLAGFYARRILRIGEPVALGGQQGMLRAITSTHVLIEDENGRLSSVSNVAFMEQVARQ